MPLLNLSLWATYKSAVLNNKWHPPQKSFSCCTELSVIDPHIANETIGTTQMLCLSIGSIKYQLKGDKIRLCIGGGCSWRSTVQHFKRTHAIKLYAGDALNGELLCDITPPKRNGLIKLSSDKHSCAFNDPELLHPTWVMNINEREGMAVGWGVYVLA